MPNNSELSDLTSALFLVKKYGGCKHHQEIFTEHYLRFLFYLFYSLWHGINDGITCSKYSDNRAQCKVPKTRSNRGRLGRVVGSLPSDFLGQFAFGMWYHMCLENIGLCIFNWHTFVAVRLSSDLKFGAYIWLVVLLIVHEVHEEIHHIGYSLIIINNQWLINSSTHQSPIDYFLAIVIYVFDVSFINTMSGL